MQALYGGGARPPRPLGFTLVELLVVVAIIAVLAGLLLPVFSRARAQARRTHCLSNLRQIGLAVQMYQQDYEELPPRLSALFPGYISAPGILLCPSDPKAGQHEGTDRLEGNLYLPSGVSYDYLPRWFQAQEWGWWQSPPHFGEGKWGSQTPLVACHWHWATYFRRELSSDVAGSSGWVVLLLAEGSVRLCRVERFLSNPEFLF